MQVSAGGAVRQMKQGGSVACVALALVAWAATTNAAGLVLTAEQHRILRAGGTIVAVDGDPGGAAGTVMAAIDVAAPPATLWAGMVDCERASAFVKGLERCRVLEVDPAGRWDVREHVVSWLWFMPRTRSEFRSDYEPYRAIRFRRTGGDLRTLEGEWRLEPLSDGRRTRLTYMARVDPGVPLPAAMVRAAIESELPKTLEALRDAVTRR